MPARALKPYAAQRAVSCLGADRAARAHSPLRPRGTAAPRRAAHVIQPRQATAVVNTVSGRCMGRRYRRRSRNQMSCGGGGEGGRVGERAVDLGGWGDQRA